MTTHQRPQRPRMRRIHVNESSGIHFTPLPLVYTSISSLNYKSFSEARRLLSIRNTPWLSATFPPRLLACSVQQWEHVYLPNVVLPGFNWRGGQRWLWDRRHCWLQPENTAELLLHHISLSRHEVIINIVAVLDSLMSRVVILKLWRNWGLSTAVHHTCAVFPGPCCVWVCVFTYGSLIYCVLFNSEPL